MQQQQLIERDRAKAVRDRAKELLVRRRFREAAELISEAIKVFPHCYKLYRLRALARACLHEYAESRSDAERVIALAPESAEGYYFKGFCLYHEKAYLAAGEAFSEGMKRTPFDRVMRQAFWDAMSLASQTRGNAA